jgi:ABC-type dipeptide/oligopeptide/nickel transport system permease component
MKASNYIGRKLLSGIPLLLGVTFISFLLMVHFGPDKTFELLGKNPTSEQIGEVRQQLGYDRPFMVRYAGYLRELLTLDLGLSESSGERVTRILARTVPVSIALVMPGFIIGNALGILLGLGAAWHRGRWLDKLIMSASDGASTSELLFLHTLKNSLVPVLTRIMFSIPLVIISGSLLLESYFGIPGIGKSTFEAITSGDQPVLKAVVGLTAVLFVLAQLLIDIFYRLVDPRLAE